MEAITHDPIRANIDRVRERIARGCDAARRDPAGVELVAVSKRHRVEAIRAAYAAGLRAFGENYVAELDEKVSCTRDLPEARWHLIGRLQRNKASRAAEAAHLVHSVDSVGIVETLARHVTVRLEVLMQLNLAGETQKSGAPAEDVPELLGALADTNGRVKAVGFMTVPPLGSPEDARPVFRRLREIRDRYGGPEVFPVLSMGMSRDLEVAIEEGATIVRIGTAIFGERPAQAAAPLPLLL